MKSFQLIVVLLFVQSCALTVTLSNREEYFIKSDVKSHELKINVTKGESELVDLGVEGPIYRIVLDPV